MRRSRGGSPAAALSRASRRPGRAAGGVRERSAPRRCVGGAARTPPTWKPRRRDRHAPPEPSAVLRRSAPRQPRAATHLLDQATQDVVIQGELADLALRVGELALLYRPRPTLEPLLAGLQERLTPAADGPGGLAGLARERVQRLTAQQPQNHLLLAPRAPAHLPAALRATVRRAAAPARALVAAAVHPTLHDSRHPDLRGLVGCPDGTGCSAPRASARSKSGSRSSAATRTSVRSPSPPGVSVHVTSSPPWWSRSRSGRPGVGSSTASTSARLWRPSRSR